ncbi:hypothetical protein [Nostoc sp. TCL26-01]|uniref:hypothetical protein n=1 Tax=Nostoc sp. TCL26-01 TaxID=2576904 RepID=UPI0015BA0680|nr:hypothetical protein [Nostoc sp. TCL26-01]QLE54249.1 hypothetical protein FD725_01105 [Nostoc sp. TCL26-01]
MIQTKLVKLAQQGNTQAIAFLMNRHLKPKGISAKVILQDSCLQVMLESAKVPQQQTLVAFVRKGIISLDAASIQRVKVYGREKGSDSPAWSEEFECRLTRHQPLADEAHILTISINLSGDNQSGLTPQNFENIANQMTSDILSSCQDVFIQKVSISDGNSVITKER